MATRNKGGKPSPSATGNPVAPTTQQQTGKAPPQPTQPAQPASASTRPAQPTAQPAQSAQPTHPQQPDPAAPSMISKGVYLSALIYVEGDSAPADDFVGPARNALNSALKGALSSGEGGMAMTLKHIDVQNDVEQDEGDDPKSASKAEDKFQF